MEKEEQQVVEKPQEEQPKEVQKKRDYFKQNFVIFFGYNGTSFHGLQRNPDVVTVEDLLEKALFEAELITEQNVGDLKKLGWKRASRTDKGVHAAMNAVSCRLIMKDKYLQEGITEEQKSQGKSKLKFLLDRDKIINVLNSYIHKDIRIFGKIQKPRKKS